MLKLKNKYFLLRHGENNWQTKKKDFIYPAGDPRSVKLTKKGIERVKKAAKKLKRDDISSVYSSDFFRTRQSAEIAAKELCIKKINFDKRLRDINLGIYHNKAKKEFYEFVNSKKRRFSIKPPKGESWNDVKKRVVSFIKDVDKKYDPDAKGSGLRPKRRRIKNILIIGHGDPLWLLEGAVRRLSIKDYIKVGELREIN